MIKIEPDFVRSEILTYLARIPRTLQENGPDCAGEVAVQLGNCLLWISGELEPGRPKVETPIHETPQTIFALGKQLRQVGLYWWEKKERLRTDRVSALESEIERLKLSVEKLQGQAVEKLGGGR